MFNKALLPSPRRARKARPAGFVLAAGGVLVSLLAVLPTPKVAAAAPEVPTQTQSVITLLNQPLLPGHLVITNGRAMLVRHTDYGILANEYGFNPKTDPDVLFKREPLPMGDDPDGDLSGPGPLPMDARYAEVFQANVNGQIDTWLAVVGRSAIDPSHSDDGASDWVLAVAGPLRDGLPLVDTVQLGAGPGGHGTPRGLAVVGNVPQGTPVLEDRPLVIVNQGNELRAFRQTNPSTYSAVRSTFAPPGSTYEHIVHRPLWDNPSDPTARTFQAGMERKFVALLREPDDQHAGRDKLRPRILQADTGVGTTQGEITDVTPNASQYNPLRNVEPASRAVIAYDYETPDWCCAGEGGGHQDSMLNSVRGFSPVVAIAPNAGGAVTTHWFHPADKVILNSFGGVRFRIPIDGGVSQSTHGECGTADAGEVPALDVNTSQMAYDISDFEDFSTDLIDVACAVREAPSYLAVVQETWFTQGPISTARLIQDVGVAEHSTVDVVQVHGCAQLNRTHRAFLDAAAQSGSTVNSSPFNVQPGADPNDALHKNRGAKELLNCSMGTPSHTVHTNGALRPAGSYPGSVTPLTVASTSAGTGLRGRSIPKRITGYHEPQNTVGGLTMTKDGATEAPRAPVSTATQGGALITALPPLTNDITVQLHQREAELVELTPQPVALLAAPPTVAGAGQEQVQDPPEFSTTTSTSAGASTMKSRANSVSLGLKAEDPLFGSASAEVKTTWESTMTSTASVDATVTIGDLYYGSVEEDTMVFNSTQAWRWTGTILSSSLGLGVGTEMFMEQPTRTVMTTQSIDQLARQYPEVFGVSDDGSPGIWTQAIDLALAHDVGNPGSYLRYNKEAPEDTAAKKKAKNKVLNDYCDGTVAGEQIQRYTGMNPFVKDPPAIIPDVLISNTHHVQVGSGGSEGAFFEIEQSTTSETASETSISVEVSAEAGFGGKVTAGASHTQGWGTAYSTSLGEGTGFSSAVGNIPHVLPDEEYDWNMFMCRRTLLPGLQVYMLNYTTNSYDGTGGLEGLGDIKATSPADASGSVALEPTLSWTQKKGTVKDYTWELQSFLAPTSDRRTGTYVPPGGEWSTPKDSQARRVPTAPLSVDVVGSGDQPLLPNTDYRWRITATDFVDGSVTSEWFYFRTGGARGAPDAGFTYAPADPEAGVPVAFTDTSNLNGAFGATYSWAFDDGENSTDASPTHTFAQPGRYDVLMEVTSSGGLDQVLRRLHVAPTLLGDVFEYEQDTELERQAGQGLLVNDLAGTSPDVSVTAQPAQGHVEVDDDGAFTYSPAAGDCADHTFTYQVIAAQRSRTADATLHGVCSPTVAGTAVTPDPVVRDGTVHLSASAVSDPGRTVASATVSIDGGTPVPLDAADGTFNGTHEQVAGAVALTGLATGDVDLCVVATDSGGLESAPDCTTVTIHPKPPVASFTVSPSPPVVGDPVTFADTSNRDGLPGTYAWDFGDGTTATGAAPVHTFAHAGDHDVSVSVQTSSGTDTVLRRITVGKGPQAIAIHSPVPAGADVGDSVVLAATGGNSGNPVTFSIDPAATGICSVIGTTLTFDAAGECTVLADQAGSADYEPAATVTVKVGVSALATTTTVAITRGRIIAAVEGSANPAGLVPSGQVVFRVDGVAVGAVNLGAGTGGVAEAKLRRSLPPGKKYEVSATYVGDPRFLGSAVSIDRSDPLLRARLHARGGLKRGWYRRPVVVKFVCRPGTGALLDSCPARLRRGRNGKDQVIRRTIRAADGGRMTVRIEGINIDRKAPKVKVLGVKNRKVYKNRRVVRCRATDRHSGIHACNVYTMRHRRLNGDLVVRYRVRASDVAGNRSTVFGSYLVRKKKR